MNEVIRLGHLLCTPDGHFVCYRHASNVTFAIKASVHRITREGT
jgi:hypothetical protein